MLYVGLDLSRKRLDFHPLDESGVAVEVGAVPPDAEGLRGLAFRLGRWNQLQAIRERRHGPDIEPWRSVVDANTG